MKLAIVLNLVALGMCTVNSFKFDTVIEEEWNLFKLRFKKVYRDVNEEKIRKKLFLYNRLKVARHNKLYENGEVTYELGINQFSDWMRDEYLLMMKGIKPSLVHENKNYTVNGVVPILKSQNDAIPKSIDWSKKGYVTPVKNQGNCGSCWAFSATGALEGQHYQKTKVLTSLSEQNLIDCSGKYGNLGCEGGLMNYAFKYIHDNKGIDTEKSYPYEAEDETCRYNSSNTGATEKGFVDIPSGNENDLMHAVATIGPVAVAVDASSDDFHAYQRGVYYDSDCSSSYLTHGMLVVGYDTDQKGGDYWIVKNSWDETWGDHGYMWLARNKDNNCGIATMASYPVV